MHDNGTSFINGQIIEFVNNFNNGEKGMLESSFIGLCIKTNIDHKLHNPCEFL